MGMYDTVNYKEPCPKCGSNRVIYQSKAGLCILSTVQAHQVPWFNGYCQECNHMDAYTTQSLSTVIVEQCTIQRQSDGVMMATEQYVGSRHEVKISG